MYEKPRLQTFGTLRELTRFGTGPDGDGFFVGRLDGPDPCPAPHLCSGGGGATGS